MPVIDSLPSQWRRIQLIGIFYTLTLVVWLWQFPTNFNEVEYIDTASVGLAFFFTGTTLFIITSLDLITIEFGWTLLTYSFYIQLLDELAEGPETLESALPGTIRLIALGIILLGFIRSTSHLRSTLSERDERLTVLNRVMRHNLRNSLMSIIEALDRAHEQADADTEPIYETALDTAYNLSELGEKTREIDRILERRAVDEPVDINEVVATHVETFRETYDDVSFTVELSPEPAFTSGRGIEAALRNVIENACEHNDANDPAVTVIVDTDISNVTVSVHDNGSGIPSHELEPIHGGDETSLNHASGIGLWFVHWVIERAGGDLSFQYQDGQTVTLRFRRTMLDRLNARLSNLVG